jgi:hypothetical protein
MIVALVAAGCGEGERYTPERDHAAEFGRNPYPRQGRTRSRSGTGEQPRPQAWNRPDQRRARSESSRSSSSP